MQQQNIKEYELTRTELLGVKSCITTYMGYVLGGSGAALFGMAAIHKAGDSPYFLAYAPSAVSTVLLLVLLVIYYKFNSHNRAAGYCKLLNHESYDVENTDPYPHILTWEVCVQELRNTDLGVLYSNEDINSIKLMGDDVDNCVLHKALEQICGKVAIVDQHKFANGWKILFNAIFTTPTTSSWGFPVFVTLIFAVLTVIFLSVSLSNFIPLIRNSVADIFEIVFHLMFLGGILIFSLLTWYRLVGKLFALMKGSATVNAFYIRFIPIRAHFLRQYDIKPTYRINAKEIEVYAKR